MNLAIKTPSAQLERHSQEFIKMLEWHLQTATRITDVDDLRYFKMRDLQEVRINLHLALELLSVVKREAAHD